MFGLGAIVGGAFKLGKKAVGKGIGAFRKTDEFFDRTKVSDGSVTFDPRDRRYFAKDNGPTHQAAVMPPSYAGQNPSGDGLKKYLPFIVVGGIVLFVMKG